MAVECPGCNGEIESEGPLVIHSCGTEVDIDEEKERQNTPKKGPVNISKKIESYSMLKEDFDIAFRILDWMPKSVIGEGDTKRQAARAFGVALHLVSCHESSTIQDIGVEGAATIVGFRTSDPIIDTLVEIEKEFGPREDWEVWAILDEEYGVKPSIQ